MHIKEVRFLGLLVGTEMHYWNSDMVQKDAMLAIMNFASTRCVIRNTWSAYSEITQSSRNYMRGYMSGLIRMVN